MKKLSLSLFIGLALSCTASQALIYRITTWSNPDRKIGEVPQKVNLFYDYHLDLPDGNATRAQNKDIKRRKTCKIVEDISDAHEHYDQNVRALRETIANDTVTEDDLTEHLIKIDPAADTFEHSILISPIKGLAQLDNTYNVEWRHAVGLGTTPTECQKFEQIFGNDVHRMIKEVAAYDDGPLLNSYYQSIVSPLLTKDGHIKTINAPGTEIVNITAPLLDARIMHTLHNVPNDPIVDIIVGGAHCDRIEPILQQLGYQEIDDIYHPQVDFQNGIVIPVDIAKTLAEPLAPSTDCRIWHTEQLILIALIIFSFFMMLMISRQPKRGLTLSLFVGMLFSCTLNHGIVTEVVRLSHPVLKQEVNLLGDFHIDARDCHATSEQYAHLAERDEKNVFRIVEDMSDDTAHPNVTIKEKIRSLSWIQRSPRFDLVSLTTYSDDCQDPIYRRKDGKLFKRKYKKAIQMSPMIGLHQLNNTYNAEWRYALGFDDALEIWEKDIQNIMHEVEQYNDGPILNAYYQSIMNESKHCLVQRHLLDARVLHAVYNNPDKPIIDVILGAGHCQNILPVLEKLGYKKIIEKKSKETEKFINNKTNDPIPAIIVPVINIKKILAEPLARPTMRSIWHTEQLILIAFIILAFFMILVINRRPKRGVTLSLFIGMLLSCMNSQAIIYRVTRWYHPELKLSEIPQEVNLFYDIHLDLPDCHATFQQHVDIAIRKAFRIVEDKTYIVPEDEESSLIFESAPLFLIKTDPSSCYEQAIRISAIRWLHKLSNTHNVEWRHFIEYFREKTFRNDVSKIIKEITAYDDGPILNAYYQSIIHNPVLSQWFNKNLLSQWFPKNIINLTYDETREATRQLLEARILHTLYNNPDKPIVDIIAGGGHCENIEPILQLLGYKKMADIYHPQMNPRGISPLSLEDLDSLQRLKAILRILIPVDIKKTLAEPLAQTLAKSIKSKL